MVKTIGLGKAFKSALLAGETKIGLFLNSTSPVVAEQLSYSGYDWLLVDAQHGPMTTPLLNTMLSGINQNNTVSLVRVGSSSDRETIQLSMDGGSDGVLIPFVKNAEETNVAVQNCLYAPKGDRSIYYPQRASNGDGLVGYITKSAENTVTSVQIETKEAIENIESILDTPNLDVAFLGRFDLAFSMGLHVKYGAGGMLDSPEMNEAVERLVDAAKQRNKILGMFLFGTEELEKFHKKGFRMFSLGNDLHHVLNTSTQFLSEVEKTELWKKRECNM